MVPVCNIATLTVKTVKELLTIHGITTDHYRMPQAYGLLPDKRSQENYTNLLEELDAFRPFAPDTL